MLKSPAAWLAALWVGVMIHVDWHLGRPEDDHRSFDLAWHWLLAIPTFLPLPRLVAARWPQAPARAGAAIVSSASCLDRGSNL